MDDDTPIPTLQKPRGYGGVATLFQKVMDLRVRKYLYRGCRIVVTEVVTDPPICIINMTCMDSKTSDDFDAVSLEVQEIKSVLDKSRVT